MCFRVRLYYDGGGGHNLQQQKPNETRKLRGLLLRQPLVSVLLMRWLPLQENRQMLHGELQAAELHSRNAWWELLSYHPKVYLYHNFLTHEECQVNTTPTKDPPAATSISLVRPKYRHRVHSAWTSGP